jgi:DNA-dependent protein kinase catalytic subunit
VIPLTTQLGLVEWVPNTQPIKAFIGDGFSQLNNESSGGRKKAGASKTTQDLYKVTAEEYKKVVMKNDVSDKSYHAMFKNVSASKVITQFQQVTKLMPADVLRSQLMSMASSPEVFLTCRNEFARTFAVWSIAGYVLGIGDRHLDNFLIDKRSGQIVPIDFGMAFGMASSILPVPELLPFRLTGQFSNVLRPLDSLGLLSHHAVLALTAFKVESTVLVRTMDVFLQDPIIDWVASCAQKRQKEEGDGEEETKTNKKTATWEPWRRIKNARRKLNGYNPMEIMLDDLGQNPNVNREGSFTALERIVRGKEAVKNPPDRQHTAALQEEYLAVVDQVACLIDIATDQNVLARQWVGLCTWI